MKLGRVFLFGVAAFILMPSAPHAQVSPAVDGRPPFAAAPSPFGLGEVMRYKVEWGIFGEVGNAKMEVVGVDTVHDRPSYHLSFEIKGRVRLLFVTAASVDNCFQSWLDVESLITRRFDQRQREPNTNRHRILEFFPSRMRWEQVNGSDSGDLATPEPLDDISFLYFARTLPLEIGQTYTYNRYWKNEGNPVVLKVLRRDTIRIANLDVPTIVVQPIINTKGIFNDGGEAEVHFSDDERRAIVYLNAKMAIARMRMWLVDYVPGRPIEDDHYWR